MFPRTPRIGGALLAACLCTLPVPAFAEKRLAMVVSNDAYAGPGSGSQATENALLIRNALQDLGFLVDVERNIGRGAMRDALRRFGARLAGPERDTVGVFYYSGAAAQAGGRSYLVPAGVRLQQERDLVRGGLELSEAIELLQTGSGRRLVLVDSAVPAPWSAGPPAAPGLARIKAPPGFLIAYSQEPDQAPRSRSTYADALNAALRTSGLSVSAMFDRVRRTVADRSAGAQLPWESSALDADLPLSSAPAAAAQQSADEALWSAVRDSADLARFDEYLARFPNGLYAESARRRLRGEGAEAAREFRDCAVCPAMISLPRGSFAMGSERGPGNERPVHSVSIEYPLAIGRYEVTLAEWDACVADQACTYAPPRGPNDHPVSRVSWDDAQVYTSWLSRKTGKRYRLPSEAEWEYAARAGTRTEFPWGDALEPNRAHCYGCAGEESEAPESAMPVGSFPPNGFGLYDMTGNIGEWTLDCYVDDYEGAPSDGRAREQGRCDFRIFRGGSWYLGPDRMRVAFRNGGLTGLRAGRVGFRVVRSP